MCSQDNKKHMPGLLKTDTDSEEYPQVAEYITGDKDPLGLGIKVRVFKSKCRENGGRLMFSSNDSEQELFEEFMKYI